MAGSKRISLLSVGLALSLAACASLSPGPGAPSPSKSVDLASHYSGTWLEIARRPMKLTDGCVAGFTTYEPTDKPGRLKVTDGCHVGVPTGRLKTIGGPGRILDPGTNAKLAVRYLGLIRWDYWVLDQAADGSWFISADPTMRNLWIYARQKPSPSQLAQMVDHAKALGYDVSKLEFPAQ